jgi:sulfur carrier protein ThiS
MLIRVKLIASLRVHLPPGSSSGVVELDVPRDTTIREAISRFDIPLDGSTVVVLNGLSVDLDTYLNEGDTLTAFAAIEGGLA